jgi:hypothetical protein
MSRAERIGFALVSAWMESPLPWTWLPYRVRDWWAGEVVHKLLGDGCKLTDCRHHPERA